MEALIAWGYRCGALGYIGLAAVCATWGGAGGLLAALGCVLGAHLGGATVWVFSTLRLQQELPNTLRGRVFACEQVGFTLAMASSTYVFSRLIDQGWLSLPEVVLCLGGVFILSGSAWSLAGSRLARIRAAPNP